MKHLPRLLAAAATAAMILTAFPACKEAEEAPGGEVPSSMLITELEVAEGTVTDQVQAGSAYYVSPAGSDRNAGTREAPFRTLYYVMDVLRKYKDQVDGDITVYLGGGYYRLFKTLEMTEQELTKADGGSILFRAVENETPILSGGLQVTGWQKTTVNGIEDVYVTRLEGLPHVRQFYAGNQAQTRAAYGTAVEWAWNKDRSGIKTYDIDLDAIVNMEDVELLWPVNWKVFVLQAKSYSGRELYFEEEMWSNFVDMIDTMVAQGQSEEYYPTVQFPVYLSGDISFLDTPGEWFYDEDTGELYYYPAEGVDMETTDFFVPVVEDLIHIHGTEEQKIANVRFEGITFRHGAWNEPSEEGLVINQAQNKMVITRSRITQKVKVEYAQIDANITVENADNLTFAGCTFENMGTTSLSLLTGIQNSTVEGCIFYQSSEGGLVLSNADASTTTDLSICKNNRIANNVFHQVGLDYWSAPALTVYYAAETTISHNDIFDVPLSGMSVGWGWYWTPNSTTSRNNVIEGNRIGKFLQKCRDGGGIYTLGQQPDSVVKGNYIFEQYGAFGGLYHDEGSAYFTTTDNVVDNINNEDPNVNWIHVNGGDGGPNGGKTTYNLEIHNNYHSNPKTSFWGEPSTCDLTGNHEVTDGQWPDEAKAIMEAAGLEDGYKHLLEAVE
ncbi:MAG TPA: right-handed parallel beta-helix repeat-containing protein [Firmicutes bacterium]|nr:right-handed parallel beta-helix repeat-containing protein [Bacillota bacterium]